MLPDSRILSKKLYCCLCIYIVSNSLRYEGLIFPFFFLFFGIDKAMKLSNWIFRQMKIDFTKRMAFVCAMHCTFTDLISGWELCQYASALARAQENCKLNSGCCLRVLLSKSMFEPDWNFCDELICRISWLTVRIIILSFVYQRYYLTLKHSFSTLTNSNFERLLCWWWLEFLLNKITVFWQKLTSHDKKRIDTLSVRK